MHYKMADLLGPAHAAIQDPAISGVLANLLTIKGFITVEKSQDVAEINGQKMIGFVYTLDPKALITSAELRPLPKMWILSNMQQAGGDTSHGSP